MNNWKDLIKNEKNDVKISFVCTGNIIRSAYAEYLAKKYFHPKNGTSKKVIFDSGACYHQNSYIHPLSKRLLLQEGFTEEQVTAHKPRWIENYLDDFNKTTLFIAMSQRHMRYLNEAYPGKGFLIKDIIEGKKEEVLDPYYYPEQGEEIMKELKELVLKFCKLLEELL